MIKLFAIDMDGTLLNSDDKISDETIMAIRKLNQAGVQSVLCTGRIITSTEYANSILKIDNPMIGNNGAIIKLNNEKILNTHPMADEDIKDLIDFCEANKVNYHFYDEDTFYSNTLNPRSLHHLRIDTDYGINIQCNLEISKDPYKRLKDKGHNALKILVGNLDTHPLGELELVKMFEDRYADRLYITTSGPGSIEIMDPKVNKYEGVLELAEFLGIKSDEIAAIGDSHNDLPMLENANLAFAMGNANQTVKDVAKYTVDDNNSLGIAQAVDIILEYNKDNPSV